MRREAPKTLHVISSPQRRGAEQVAWALSERLRELGGENSVVAIAPGQHPDTDLAVPVVGEGRARSAVAIARLVRHARDVEVVVSHGGTTLLPCIAAGLASRRPVVYRNIGDPSYWAPSGPRRAALGWALRRTAGIVALYPGAAAWMSDAYRIAPTELTVVASPVDGQRFRRADGEARAAARTTLGVRADAPVIAFVGALSSEKRPELAVEVARALPGTELVMAGDGPLRDVVERLAAPIGDRCHLLGQVTDVRPVYAAADVVLIPSDTEGVPGALLESVLVGTPVVGSPVGGIPDLLRGGLGRTAPNDVTSLAAACSDVLGGPRVPAVDRDRLAHEHSLEEVSDRWAHLLRAASEGRSIGTQAGPQ